MLFEKVHKTPKIVIDKAKIRLMMVIKIFLNKTVILIPLYRGIC